MKNKTKDELIKIIENQQETIEKLENDRDYYQSEYELAEEERDKLQEELDNIEEFDGIKNINNFIFRLKVDGLYSDVLQKFIDDYKRYHND